MKNIEFLRDGAVYISDQTELHDILDQQTQKLTNQDLPPNPISHITEEVIRKSPYNKYNN